MTPIDPFSREGLNPNGTIADGPVCENCLQSLRGLRLSESCRLCGGEVSGSFDACIRWRNPEALKQFRRVSTLGMHGYGALFVSHALFFVMTLIISIARTGVLKNTALENLDGILVEDNLGVILITIFLTFCFGTFFLYLSARKSALHSTGRIGPPAINIEQKKFLQIAAAIGAITLLTCAGLALISRLNGAVASTMVFIGVICMWQALSSPIRHDQIIRCLSNTPPFTLNEKALMRWLAGTALLMCIIQFCDVVMAYLQYWKTESIPLGLFFFFRFMTMMLLWLYLVVSLFTWSLGADISLHTRRCIDRLLAAREITP